MALKTYYVKILSKEHGSTILYIPKELSQFGYGSSKYVQLILNDDETITISKIKDSDGNNI